jgi:DNA-binding CsgD family transcriptional regulator
LFKTHNDLWGEMNATFALGIARHTSNKRAAARSAFERTVELGQQIASPWGVLRGIIGLAAIRAAAGDVARGARLLGAVDALSQHVGPMLNAEGEALRTETITMARRQLGEQLFGSHWDLGYKMTITTAVDEAFATSVEVDAKSGTSGAWEPEGPTPGSGVGQFRLSPRERQVLSLLCKRFTDREIADKLFISPRTVTTHVTSIFNKLSVNSRRVAAAVAVRNGLI